MSEYLDLLMFDALMVAVLSGFPVSFSIAGVAVAFAYLGWSLGIMDVSLLGALGQRAFGLLTNTVLIAIPVFVLMGAILATLGMSVLLLLEVLGLATPILFFALMVPMGVGNGMLMPNASAGMLSVRPSLAGSAAGLGGAFMIGGGAALSALAGFILGPQTGATPLVGLMLVVSAAAILSILWVIRRERVVKASGG